MNENQKKPETIKHKIFRYIRNIVLVGLFLVIAWPAVYFPQTIRVVDYDTREPIADAFVMVNYIINSRSHYILQWYPAPHGLNFAGCFELLFTKTDKQGYFEAPFKIGFFGALGVWPFAYKQGYRHKGNTWGGYEKSSNTVYLIKDNQSSADRIQYISSLFSQACVNNNEQDEYLDKRCYFEMKEIAETPEDMQKIEDFKRAFIEN